MFCAGLSSTGAKCIYIFVVVTSPGCTDKLPGPMVKRPICKSVQYNGLHHASGSVQPGSTGSLI